MNESRARYPRSFHVVAKPIGSVCNLDCRYCYYRCKESSDGRISDELLEKFVRQYIAGQEDDPVVFNWHGGEPALLGLDFFRRVVELERRYADGHRIENDFQTNGVLLDERWCAFFQEHGFYVGLSIDGPKHLHDHYRAGFDQTYRAALLLRQYEVPFNALTVVNRVTAKHPAEVYKFLTEDLGCQRLQWLPCVGHRDYRRTAPGYWTPDRIPAVGTHGARPGNGLVTDWSVDADDWGDFLCQTFDLWMKDIGKVFVNWFESFVGQWMGKPAQICTLAPVCGRSLSGKMLPDEAHGHQSSCGMGLRLNAHPCRCNHGAPVRGRISFVGFRPLCEDFLEFFLLGPPASRIFARIDALGG